VNCVTQSVAAVADLPALRRWWILPRHPEDLVLTRRRLSLIARILSLALLVGQLGAEAHAYSHLSDATKSRPDAAQGCRTCLSFAPVHSAVGGSLVEFVVTQCALESFLPVDQILIPAGRSRPAFQSRAPPILL